MPRIRHLISNLLLAAAGATALERRTRRHASAQAPWARPAAPGRLIEVAPGRRLHILCKGEDRGPVIIVAGMSQYTSLTAYGKVQDEIAQFEHVASSTVGARMVDRQPPTGARSWRATCTRCSPRRGSKAATS